MKQKYEEKNKIKNILKEKRLSSQAQDSLGLAAQPDPKALGLTAEPDPIIFSHCSSLIILSFKWSL